MSVALVIQNAKRMRCMILSMVWLYHIFPHYLKNGTIFGKKSLNIKCVLIYYTTVFDTLLVLRRIKRDIRNVHAASGTVPIILVKVQQNLNFLHRLSQKAQISNFIEIRLVGAELFRADGQT